MYNSNFGYVEVIMDKHDCMVSELISDLESWCERLYRVESDKTEDSIIYKGLLKRKDIRHLDTLTAVSPYGLGYNIKVDGVDIDDYLNSTWVWKRSRGLV